MSAKRVLARILVLAILNFGAVLGVPVNIEEMEKLMQVMHRTQIESVVKKDDP